MKRAWHVEMVCSVDLIRLGLLCEHLLDARPQDAGASEIDRVKIRPIDPELGLNDRYVYVFARGIEL